MGERRLADEMRKELTVTKPCVTCTFCSSTDYTKCGTRKNKNDTVQRYKCGSCRHRFTHNPGFVGRHHTPDTITDALQSYTAGLSASKSRLHEKERNQRECLHRVAVGKGLQVYTQVD